MGRRGKWQAGRGKGDDAKLKTSKIRDSHKEAKTNYSHPLSVRTFQQTSVSVIGAVSCLGGGGCAGKEEPG